MASSQDPLTPIGPVNKLGTGTVPIPHHPLIPYAHTTHKEERMRTRPPNSPPQEGGTSHGGCVCGCEPVKFVTRQAG